MRRRTTRAKLPAVPLKPHERIIKYLKEFSGSEHGEHITYIANRLCYLVMVMIIAAFIQFAWNSTMNMFFQGEHQMDIFQAAILWVCIY